MVLNCLAVSQATAAGQLSFLGVTPLSLPVCTHSTGSPLRLGCLFWEVAPGFSHITLWPWFRQRTLIKSGVSRTDTHQLNSASLLPWRRPWGECFSWPCLSFPTCMMAMVMSTVRPQRVAWGFALKTSSTGLDHGEDPGCRYPETGGINSSRN